jgi:hypothetical protein
LIPTSLDIRRGSDHQRGLGTRRPVLQKSTATNPTSADDNDRQLSRVGAQRRQMATRPRLCKQEVRGSIPRVSTQVRGPFRSREGPLSCPGSNKMQQRCSELSLFRALSSRPRRTVRSPALPDGSRSWVLPKWGDARWTCSQPDVERFRGDRAGQIVAPFSVTARAALTGRPADPVLGCPSKSSCSCHGVSQARAREGTVRRRATAPARRRPR